VSTLGVGQFMLNKHLTEFLELYPALDVHLQFSDQFPDLHHSIGEPIDIVYGFAESLITDHLVHPDLVRHRIGTFQRIVCAAPAYLAEYGEPKSYEDLTNHCIITHSKSIHNFIFQECRNRQIKPRRILAINNNASILNLVLNGSGLASVPNVIIQDELAKGQLKQILHIHHEPEIPVYLFYKKTRYRPAKISYFLKFYLPA
jgi:DNA-binding transcriptional LysR family regulator